MPSIVPIKDLRKTNEISELCHSINEPVFVTKNGYGDLVVMSVETYDSIMREKEIDQAIFESEKELAEGGKAVDARVYFEELEEKYFG